jgi:hypothetical protein
MKITAVYDNEGTILAAVIDDGRYDLPRPVPMDGQQGGTFDLPPATQAAASVTAPSLADICTTFKVDPKSMSLTKR